MVRVAEALDAVVMQHCRREAEGRYLPVAGAKSTEHVVVLRDARALRDARRLFPNARPHVWLHDLARPGSTRARWLELARPELSGATLVCVSEFLRKRVASIIEGWGSPERVKVSTIFNPIDDDLAPDQTCIDDSKLLYLSSPNKGLAYALMAFLALRRVMPQLRLYVANPGYKLQVKCDLEGVVWLGTLPPRAAVAQARSALGIFMPNLVIPETFGLVYAEANAVGTPVLAHDVGAASEVLHAANPPLASTVGQRACARLLRQVGLSPARVLSRVALRAGIIDAYIDTLREWRTGHRPQVLGDERFRLQVVAAQWRKLFDADAHSNDC